MTYWICELSTKDKYSTLEEFAEYIKANEVTFDDDTLHLSYTSGGKKMELTFGGDFLINSQAVDTEYSRFDSPYSQAQREPETILIEFDGKSLYLDFASLERIVTD